MAPIRILFHSNRPGLPTGYGIEAGLFITRIAALGHEVIASAFYGIQGDTGNWKGHLVLPPGIDAYGSDIIAEHVRQSRADALITLMDAWVLDKGQIRAIHQEQGVPVAAWMPVDTLALGEPDENWLRETGAFPVAMSRHGQAQLTARGFDAAYVPHACETSVFRPAPDREEVRRRFGHDGRFIVGIAAANKDSSRKAFGEQFEAFSRFHARHPEAILSVHSVKGGVPTGLNLVRMAQRKGVAGAVSFSDQYRMAIGAVTAAELAEWYSAIDVLSSASYGEGFGIPVLEAQSCGTPVVVNDATAMTELCGSGWKVRGQPWWNEWHGESWQVPFIDDIEAAYEEAYELTMSGAIEAKRQATREFALGYDADLVLEQYWKPVLARLEQMRQEDRRIVRHAGLDWRVDGPEDHGDRLGPFHEESVEDSLLSLLPPGGVFLDVGAHVGHYTLRAAEAASKVIAVEPNPATAARLRDNIALNEPGNVTVLEVAAWDENALLRLDSPAGHERDGSTRVIPDDGGTVTGCPLDDLLADEPRIDLVKLDVEGADLHALRGMRETLSRLRPVLWIEDHSVYGCYDRSELVGLLGGYGYEVRPAGMYGCAPYLVALPVAVPAAARDEVIARLAGAWDAGELDARELAERTAAAHAAATAADLRAVTRDRAGAQ